MESFIMAGGIPVRVADSKKGDKSIVLLHGYLETLSIWEEFAKALSEKYRVICIDLPGHGLSGTNDINTMEFMADVLNATLDKIGIREAFIAGHSMGGYVALAFAQKYSEKTTGLCLLHSTPNPDTDEKRANRDREIALIEAAKLELIAQTAIPNIFAPANVSRMRDTIEEIETNALIATPEGITACLRGMKERQDMNAFLKNLAKPLLFIFGKYDNLIPVNVAEKLIADFPQAHVAWLEQSGHAGFLEEPQAVLDALSAFVN